MLEKFKKLMDILQFESRQTFDNTYYWYGEKKLLHNGIELPHPMKFHITIKTIPLDEKDIIVTTEMSVSTNETIYDMPIDKKMAFIKDYFKYELRIARSRKILKHLYN